MSARKAGAPVLRLAIRCKASKLRRDAIAGAGMSITLSLQKRVRLIEVRFAGYTRHCACSLPTSPTNPHESLMRLCGMAFAASIPRVWIWENQELEHHLYHHPSDPRHVHPTTPSDEACPPAMGLQKLPTSLRLIKTESATSTAASDFKPTSTSE